MVNTWYRYQTFKVSKYRLDSSIILLYLNVDTYFVIWILYADFQIHTIVLTYRIWTYNASIEYRTQFWYRQVSKQLGYRPSFTWYAQHIIVRWTQTFKLQGIHNIWQFAVIRHYRSSTFLVPHPPEVVAQGGQLFRYEVVCTLSQCRRLAQNCRSALTINCIAIHREHEVSWRTKSCGLPSVPGWFWR